MEVTCAFCNIKVYKRPRDVKKSKSGLLYCSNDCFSKSRLKQRETKLCQFCNSQFLLNHNVPFAQKFCSRACANKSRIGTAYKQNRSSKDKAAIRKALKEELKNLRGALCERCGYNEHPDILIFHHIIPKGRGGPDAVENGELLCPNCHALHHLINGY